MGGWKLVKLEVLGDKKTLYPNMIETINASEKLVSDGFKVLAYCNDDPVLCKILEETGFEIKINRLLGVFSSLKYESVNYPWKGREYLHCFFMGEIIGGVGSPTGEAEEIGTRVANQLLQQGGGVLLQQLSAMEER